MTNSLQPEQVDELLRLAQPGASVHLIGAGGCGMSGIGHLLLDLGFRVVGSDLVDNVETRQLRSRGARILVGHDGHHLAPGTLLLVYSSAVRQDNPELEEARRRGIPAVRRAVLLAALLRRQRGVCVAGMHGKTTTTALLAFALNRLSGPTSYAVGALVPQLTCHARFYTPPVKVPGAEAPFFVIEADESDGTLGQFRPEHAVILNIDAEHLDHFGNLDAITAEFRQFAQQTRGHVIFCADDPRLAELFATHPRALSYGYHPLAVYRAEIPASEPQRGIPRTAPPTGGPSPFRIWHRGELLASFSACLLGEQNVSNATAVVALLHQLGFAPPEIAAAMAPFRGAARRQQEIYADECCRVFEDYGHHPNEIRATLRALKALRPKRLLVVFQPHRFTRTQHLWKEFAGCFTGADRLWLAEVYPASEPEIPGINSGFLATAIQNQGQRVDGVVSLAALSDVISSAVQPGDLVLFLGAGDITKVAHEFAEARRAALGHGRTAPAPFLPPAGAAHSAGSPAMKSELFNSLKARLTPETVLRCDESLAKRTTLRVGGAADFYAEPASESDLAEILKFCRKHALPVVMLGRGSNLLIRDGGVRGMVISLGHPHFSQVHASGEKLQCGAGAKLKAVAAEAKAKGLSGLEFLEGIPGTVGGAMRMNAGAMGSWLFDVVERVRFMDFQGVVRECKASEINVEYRGCPLFRDHIALGAVLRGAPAPKPAIQAKMEAFSRKRWESQPSQPSAGCIFKNPSSIPAGRLIDELGLKGTRVGGAVVSDVHANFIVNDGHATARDVLNLIEIIKERARSARGIELETEVQILGEG